MARDFKFGLTHEQLWEQKLIYAEDLFAQQRVLISGGSGGIGKAVAWFFARLGATVILTGRDEAKLETTADALRSKKLSVETFCFDIRDPDAVEAAMTSVFSNGGLQLLVNNAGGQFPKPAMDITANGWKAVVDTNLNGTWFMMQAAARHWSASSSAGRIINIVTVVDNGMPNMAHTCAARAGVVHASKTVAVEWAPHQIQVNCIAPGVIDSEGMKAYSDQARAAFDLANPMKEYGSVWDIAQACGYLASDASRFITGEVLTVDGGGRFWGELWTDHKPEYFKR